MLFATRFRLFFVGLLPLLAGFIASSCQSSRPSFSFQPAPYRAMPVVAPGVRSAPADAAAPASAPAPAAAAVGAATPHLSARRLARVAAMLPRLAAAPADPTVPTATALPQAQARHLPRLLRQRTTHGAAESGLGNIGLFVIGVVLAILAGLAALFALIPGVSFWGGVGLAVAALVVLYLLYSLASGGKKKK